MSQRNVLVVVLLVLVGTGVATGSQKSSTSSAGKTTSEADIRSAATRGMAAIQTAQKVSRKTQTCAGTCHLQGYGSQAYGAAHSRGIPLEVAVARDDATRAFASVRNLPAVVQRNALTEVAMNGAFFLVSTHAVGQRPTVVTSALARALALQQNPDGSWVAMSGRPPSNASRFAFTAIGLRAIQLYGHPAMARDVARRVERAREWLESHTPRNTEDRAYQLIGLSWAGRSRQQLATRARELAATQQPDGGWTSLDGRPGDAYATGEALVALHDAAGMSLNDAVWKRGLEFLLRTQAADGTWHVRTRLPAWISPPYFESGYPYKRDQFISVAGASWAVMALTRALTPVANSVPLPLDDAAPPAVEPWVETAMFGTVDDLEQLLKTGLSPNATTQAGGIPLLSLVVPDVDKVRVLVAAGADVNARSQLGFSPLLVASQYVEANPAIRLLLKHSARVTTADGEAPPAANATPVFFAAHAGNVEILPTFVQAGARVDAATNFVGLRNAAIPPLVVAARFGRTDVARALLDLGAPIEQANRALATAVSSNHPDLVRFLLGRGANVNVADAAGRTPLMHAAAVDFGHSTIVDMLLAAGARTDVRDEEGLTALERARQNGNMHVIPSLERAERRR